MSYRHEKEIEQVKQKELLLVTLQATPIELIAVGSAIIGYIRLLECTVPPSKERKEVITALLAFQKRLADNAHTADEVQRKRHN